MGDDVRIHYEAVLGDLRAKKDREIQEAIQKITQKYDMLITAMQAAMGGGLAAAALGGVADEGSDGAYQGGAGNGEVRITTGEFHGMSYPAAARSVLERTNRTPLITQQILAYIEKSGRKVEGKNPAGTIYSSLKRSPDFELVARNTWGLAVWYNIKRKPKLTADTTTPGSLPLGETPEYQDLASAEPEETVQQD